MCNQPHTRFSHRGAAVPMIWNLSSWRVFRACGAVVVSTPVPIPEGLGKSKMEGRLSSLADFVAHRCRGGKPEVRTIRRKFANGERGILSRFAHEIRSKCVVAGTDPRAVVNPRGLTRFSTILYSRAAL